MQPDRTLARFLLRVALCVLPCFGMWYWLAEWFSSPAALASSWLLTNLFPAWIESADWSQRMLRLYTNLNIGYVPGLPKGQMVVLIPVVRPLQYTYGLPLFYALSLACAGPGQFKKILLGTWLLIPFQIIGIFLGSLFAVAITAGPQIAAHIGFVRWQRELIALGNEISLLIMPTAIPILVWVILNRRFVAALVAKGKAADPENPVLNKA